ncbi:MAG: L-aspartate oxidase [Nitrospirae bacterium]|nr:L-aspartate oxidase [Nitrospirota bacterium]
MNKEYTDFLIIGSGVAGLSAAIKLAPHGEVLVVTKDIPSESTTGYAQGGIAVALSDEDEVGIHYRDTLKAGDGLCRKEAVRILVEEGPQRILELISWGAKFDKEGSRLAFTLEAAHTRKRILHAHGDATGKELTRVLLNKVRSFTSIKRSAFSMAVDLIMHDGTCIGAYVLRDREVLAVFSRATILATGGGGQIFSITTNPQVATGDGMAIAYRAGARLEDMEFIQFHPTSLYLPSAPHFLLSEAMRGEGGLLRNIKGKLFMKRYHPMAELAPRDVVSRAIITEMFKTKSTHVYLDLTHLKAGFIKKRFPRIYSTCLQFDCNITNDLIPVCPAAHYVMGGVKTNIYGRTNIKGLFAAGEAACTGVHGANRLASNSLLEGLVYGKRAGEAVLRGFLGIRTPKAKVRDFIFHSIPAHDVIRGELRKLMWEKVGIIRCKDSLTTAKKKLSEWSYILDKQFLTRRELELKNMLEVANLITDAALLREGSVGAHYRSDFPNKGKNWQKHITPKKDEKL